MEKVVLKDLIRATKGKFVFGNPKQPVLTISSDTRKIKHGDVFFALKGKRFDGHNFVTKAIESGVSAMVVTNLSDQINAFFPNIPAIIIVEDTLKALGDFASFYRTQFSSRMICITGSNGKTTTKEIAHSIFSLVGPTLANFGTYNNLIGVPVTLFELNSQHAFCIVEIGISFKGEIDRLISIAYPDISVITNIGNAHLELLDDLNGVFVEKKKIATGLTGEKYAVLNIDDPYLAELIPELKCRVITYGFNNRADIFVTDEKYHKDTTEFVLHVRSAGKPGTVDRVNVKMPAVGKFNIYNAIAAAGAAHAAEIDLQTIKHGIEKFIPPQMRMETIELPSGATIINDAYNANPDSMRRAIECFIQIYPNREKVVVLGDMLELGKHSAAEHKKLGEFLSALPLKEVYLYGDEITNAVGPMKKTESNGPKYFPASKIDNLMMQLNGQVTKPVAILFKASRLVGLEKIIDKLIQ